MGKRIAGRTSQVSQGQGGQPEHGKPGPAADTKTNSTSSGGIGDIRIIGDGGASTDTQTKSVGLPEVTPPAIPAPDTKPKPKKKKATTTPTKANDAAITAEMLASLLGVTFNLLAVRMGPHWQLSQTEAMALAEPTTKIMARYDITKKTGAYADFIALGVAVMGIVIPKVMMELSKPKAPKGDQRHVESVEQRHIDTRKRTTPDTEAGKAVQPDPNPQGAASPASYGGNDGIKASLVHLIQPT